LTTNIRLVLGALSSASVFHVHVDSIAFILPKMDKSLQYLFFENYIYPSLFSINVGTTIGRVSTSLHLQKVHTKDINISTWYVQVGFEEIGRMGHVVSLGRPKKTQSMPDWS